MSDVTLGFNDLSAGTIVDGQYSAKGVTVSSANASTPIMIFDTNNVTGGDHDLATHNLDNVLILSEDGDQNDPDDNAHGGTFRFDFDGTTTVKELTFLDIEEGAKVRFFDGDGNFMGVCEIPATYDNGQLVACFDVANVGSMEVVLPGSGAIDNLVFEEITPTNDAPDAVDDMAEMDEDTSIVLSVLDNDTDPDGDPLTIISAVSPQGKVVINDDGTLTFTPNENFNGMTTVDYVVSDGNGGTDKAWVKVTVHAVNDAPDAVDDHDTTQEDTSIVIDLLDNDTDVDGDPLMVTFVSVPAEQGTVVNNGDGTATFTPAADFTGTAMISYDIKDGQGGRDWAKHFVEVTPTNDAPDAVDDMAEMDEDTSIVLSVLDNDTDPDGDPLTIISAVSPQGKVVINDDGTLTFTPNENFNGMTTVDYVVSDGNGGTDKAWVKVTVHAVNDAPDAVDDHDTTQEDTSIVIDLLDNDTDVDGDPLMVTFVSVPAEQGTVVNNGDGTATFTPAADFTGTAMISYDIKDGQGGRDWAKHFVEVTPTNDAPDAVDDMAEMDEDTSIVLSVLDNDADPDGDPLTIISAVSRRARL